jgi:hypothetical protein
MKKQLSLIAIAAGAIVLATAPSFAQTAFDPTNPLTLNEDGSAMIAPGVTGDPTEFSVTGDIDEFLQITYVDDKLELGDLGGAEKTGWVSSDASANADSGGTGPVVGVSQNKTYTDAAAKGNGYAEVLSKSNTYVTVSTSYGTDLTQTSPNGDVYTLPTKYRVSVFGKKIKFPSDSTVYNFANYASYSPSVAAGTASSVTYGPSATQGAKVMAVVQRDGLNNFKGTYTASVALTYSKF